MNDNPYASPKTAGASREGRSQGMPWSEMSGLHWLFLFGGWIAVGGAMIGAFLITMSACEFIELSLGSSGSTKGTQVLYGIAILGVPVLVGKGTAMLYRWQYAHVAAEVANRHGEGQALRRRDEFPERIEEGE